MDLSGLFCLGSQPLRVWTSFLYLGISSPNHTIALARLAWLLQGRVRTPPSRSYKRTLTALRVLGCTLQACKPCTCPVARRAQRQQQRHQGFNGWGRLPVWSKDLEQHPIPRGAQQMAGRTWWPALYPIKGGIDVRSVTRETSRRSHPPLW